MQVSKQVVSNHTGMSVQFNVLGENIPSDTHQIKNFSLMKRKKMFTLMQLLLCFAVDAV